MAGRFIRTVGALACFVVIMLISDVAAIVTPERKVTVLRGAAAKAHMGQKIAQNPAMQAAHEKAVQELRAKGYMPTDGQIVTIVTMEPTLLQRAAMMVVPTLAAQTYSQSGTGETDVDPWDAGNNAIFTGEVILIDYQSDGWGAGTMAFDVGSDSSFGFLSANGDTGPGPVGAGAGHFSAAIEDWAWCSIAGCAGSLTACWMTGPMWGQCALGWRVGSEVLCAVAGIGNHIRHPQG